ncbi:OmpA family protein [Roseibium marinum]|uniref:Outer membrane protein OmpA-like peptidoglycan-associated protein n=1 Tax=Roseibium marinum TaxID=281252 RepID=A0A2S3V2F6_9HYPH|nr:OmpA family protein [Roseibium marinum]POF34162.1 outer membrane protein OmpA-like peptidoglycan-associated protein [Roseibium marinum]
MNFARSVLPELTLAILAALLLLSSPAGAQENFFERGWTLQPEASSLRFQSVKNLTKVESSGFADFAGTIDESGAASIRIFLDSIDTKIDLRNVRMRFLFFETFQFPEVVITTRIDQSLLTDLPALKRKIIPLTYTLSLHGLSKTLETEVAVTIMSDDLVAVSTTAPISVAASDFGLDGGIQKLEEAADVVIVPSATVSFDFVFSRNGGEGPGAQTAASSTPQPATQPATQPAPQAAAAKALEPEGDFDIEACKGRFEILSRTGNIYFGSGSARLDARSEPLLNSLSDIISRCPGLVIEIGGHTDSDGSAAANIRLSERRAAAVKQYLTLKNIPADRIVSVGYGEARPVAPNGTADGKRRNRRIEFVVVE